MTKEELLVQAALGTIPFKDWVHNDEDGIPPEFKDIVESSDDIKFLTTLRNACTASNVFTADPTKKQWDKFKMIEDIIWDRLRNFHYHYGKTKGYKIL
jgi:hypothetical protein